MYGESTSARGDVPNQAKRLLANDTLAVFFPRNPGEWLEQNVEMHLPIFQDNKGRALTDDTAKPFSYFTDIGVA